MLWAYNIRALAILAVVVLHTAAGFISGIDNTSMYHGTLGWWSANFFDAITRWCVPVFVMISGYFLLNSNDSIPVFFKKRFARLFIPLLFWSITYCLWLVLKLYVKGELNLAGDTILHNILAGRPYYHLWFLYMLPFLYLSTPYLRVLLHSCEKKYSAQFIFISFSIAALNVFVNNAEYSFTFKGDSGLFVNDFLLYVGYFMLGGFVNKYKVDLKSLHLFFGLFLAWSITIFGSYFLTYKYFYDFLSVNTVIASICVFFLIIKFFNFNFMNLGKVFSNASFGIYLIHPIVLESVSLFLKDKLVPCIGEFFYIPLISVIVFISSFLAIYIMSKLPCLKKCI